MNSSRHLIQALSIALALLCFGCEKRGEIQDPAPRLPLLQAPPESRAFFTPAIDPGVLYSYITKQGDIFVYRRDLDMYAWVTLEQFKPLVEHAAAQPGRIVYTLEDGDLHDPKNLAAFMVIRASHAPTQDPIEVLPLVKTTRPGKQ